MTCTYTLSDTCAVGVWSAKGMATVTLEVWPESHWPGFALRQDRGITVLCGMIVSVIRFKTHHCYIDNRR